MRYRSSLIFILTVLLSLAASLASAQNVKNPSVITFNSSDHAALSNYEIDIIRKDGTVVQTISVAVTAVTSLPAGNTSCLVSTAACFTTTINVQPTAFGTDYTIKVRAVGGGVKSDDSSASNAFDRAPGAPTNAKIK